MQIQINIPKDQLEAAVSEAIRKQAPPPPTTPKLSYKLKEAAAATGMSVAWFRGQIRKRKIKTVTLGRTVLITAAELQRLLTKETTPEQAEAEKWSTNEETFGGLNLSSTVN
jgi:hypothetical protein